jgi:hypothetical protein
MDVLDPLLAAVLSLTQRAYAQDLDKGMAKRQAAIANQYTRLEVLDLGRYFKQHPEQGDTSAAGDEMRSFIFLPVVDVPPLLPILSMSYDLAQCKASLQAGVFVRNSISEKNPAAFGYRFEQPEGGGRHDYWHAQPFRSFKLCKGQTRALPRIENWARPDDTPAFPLDAEAPIDLLVTLMISIYGLKLGATMLVEASENALGTRIGMMRSRRRPIDQTGAL